MGIAIWQMDALYLILHMQYQQVYIHHMEHRAYGEPTQVILYALQLDTLNSK